MLARMEASPDEGRPGLETETGAEALSLPGVEPEPTSPDGLRWWKRALAEADSREFAARRRARDLSRELADARIEEGRASARLEAVSDQLEQATAEAERNARDADAQGRLAAEREAELSATRSQLREVKADRRVLANRSEKLADQLDEIRSSRAYGFLRLIWKVKRGLGRPFRPFRRS